MHIAHQRIVRSLIAIAIAVFVLPSPARAQDVQTDAKCWPQAQCGTARGTFDATAEACGAPGWGFCYVQKPIGISVNIPGAQGKTVADFREYLILVYRWGINVAAIVAVVAIMVGGLIWLTSGGADRLKTAKQWIGNAIVGLLLVLGSYVLLQTVNPDLVRLQLPRTLMLRPISLGARFCALVDANTQVRKGDGSIVDPSEYAKLPCGYDFATTGAAQKSCFGQSCDAGKVCVPFSTDTFRCEDGTIGGEVVGDGDAFLDNNVRIAVVCTNGTVKRLASIDGTQLEKKRKHKFVFPTGTVTIAAIESACGGSYAAGTLESKVRGFFLEVEVNDDAYVIGNDDWYAIGSDSCSGGSQPLKTPTGPQEYMTDPARIAWPFVPQEQLFSAAKVVSAIRDVNFVSFTCNIGLTRGAFPDRLF